MGPRKSKITGPLGGILPPQGPSRLPNWDKVDAPKPGESIIPPSILERLNDPRIQGRPKKS